MSNHESQTINTSARHEETRALPRVPHSSVDCHATTGGQLCKVSKRARGGNQIGKSNDAKLNRRFWILVELFFKRVTMLDARSDVHKFGFGYFFQQVQSNGGPHATTPAFLHMGRLSEDGRSRDGPGAPITRVWVDKYSAKPTYQSPIDKTLDQRL